jgi:hypothetical protein
LPGTVDQTTLPVGGTTGFACGAASTPGADGYLDPASLRYAPIGGQFATQEFDRKRDGIALAGQWQSNDERTVLTAQFLRTHTVNNTSERTFETAPDLAEYNTYPVGCLQNNLGPTTRRSPSARPARPRTMSMTPTACSSRGTSPRRATGIAAIAAVRRPAGFPPAVRSSRWHAA